MVDHTTLRVLFPVASVELVAPDGLWDAEVDPRSLDGVRTLYNLIVLLENSSQDEGLDSLVRTARALRSDLLALSVQSPGAVCLPDLHALMLATTLGPAGLAVMSRRTNVAYDWLLWSMTTEWQVDGEHILHVEWLPSAAQCQLADAVDEIVRPWLLTLYQYDWQTAGLPELTETLSDSTLALAKADLVRERFDVASGLLSWAGNHAVTSEFAAELRRIGSFLADIADSRAILASTKFRALKPLALCSGSVTGQDQRRRAKDLLTEFRTELNNTDRLGAMGTALSGNPQGVASEIATFIDLAHFHNAQFAEHSESPQAAAWARGGMHSLIDVPMLTLLADGRVELALRLLRAWHGHDDQPARQPHTLVAVASRGTGVDWVVEHGLFAGRAMTSLPDLQTAANAFLGNTVTVSTSPGIRLDVGDRGRGIPDDARALGFQQTAEEFLDFPTGEQAYTSAEHRPTSLLVLPTLQVPVQALMLRRLGWTLPMTVSLERPKPDRPLQEALIYVGDSLFSHRELEAATTSLAAAGVALTIRDELDLSRTRFLEDYNNPKFDLIWVGTHGVFDGLRPDEAYLHLTDSERVGLEDLSPPSTTNRRLLVLNACDGGTTALMGGIGEIGLAAAATSPDQAVISHQWPIKSATVAPVYAGVLSRALSAEATFFQAYQTTLSVLGGDPVSLRTDLVEVSEQLARLVEDNPEDFQSLAGWASAAFFE